ESIGHAEPFGGGTAGVDFESSDPESTGLIMQFRVVAARSTDATTPPLSLVPAAPGAVAARGAHPPGVHQRGGIGNGLCGWTPWPGHKKHQPANIKLACNDPNAEPFGPTHATLGTLTASGDGNPLLWMQAITENPAPGATEVWEIHNTTEDAHPIHLHLVQFEIVE